MNDRKLNILKAYFGYDSLRPGQDEITDAILSGRDVLGIMPTGAGKSLCYQLPALMFPGMTIVVSPLISLMEDQTTFLTSHHIDAVCITSKLDRHDLDRIYHSLSKGRYKLVYVSPERLQNPDFCSVCGQCAVSLICIDEAHCIDSWGEDFRPAYRNIAGFAESVGTRPVIAAFTATALPGTADFIIKNLGLSDPFIINTGYRRDDLRFEVCKCAGNKYSRLLSILGKHTGQCGIIYCSTRRSVEELYAGLSGKPGKYRCRDGTKPGIYRYHGGMDPREREIDQKRFIESPDGIMIATCAFGMGIDKGDIRFIIHYEIPGSIEDYYQEAGRASRDKKGAVCTLLYSLDDIPVRLSLIRKDVPMSHPDYTKLRSMIDYCRFTGDLQEYIISYFSGKNKVPARRAAKGRRHAVRPRSDLYDHLSLMRKRLAASLGINESKIFTNQCLRAMSASLPSNFPALLMTEGVYIKNAMKYGKYFIYVISVYTDFIS